MNTKILYWTQLFWPYVGGIEVLGSKFLPTMQARGYEFVVITSHGSLDLPDEAIYNDIPIYRFPFQTALSSGNIEQIVAARQRLARVKKDFQPDLIHINFTDPSIFFHWQTVAAHLAPTIVSIRLALPDELAGANTLTGQSLRAADWITANSQAMLDDIEQIVPEAKPHTSVIYNGLEMPELALQPLPFDEPSLLCLGRVVEDKGFDLAIKALSSITKQFPAVRLMIAGDGPTKADLEQLAVDLGVAQSVDFVGWIPPEKVSELMNRTTIVIMPSRWREAFGLVALQAAQMARPVVATRVGGLPEVVAHNETGLIVEKENSEALADSVLVLLKNQSQAVEMGKNGYRRARQMFGWEQHIDAYDQLYQKMIRKR